MDGVGRGGGEERWFSEACGCNIDLQFSANQELLFFIFLPAVLLEVVAHSIWTLLHFNYFTAQTALIVSHRSHCS